MEFSQSNFSESPERFNAVDMAFSIGKLISSMVDSVMFFITNIDKAVIAAPPIRVDNAIRVNTTAYNGL